MDLVIKPKELREREEIFTDAGAVLFCENNRLG
jgi:hypothetical protein